MRSCVLSGQWKRNGVSSPSIMLQTCSSSFLSCLSAFTSSSLRKNFLSASIMSSNFPLDITVLRPVSLTLATRRTEKSCLKGSAFRNRHCSQKNFALASSVGSLPSPMQHACCQTPQLVHLIMLPYSMLLRQMQRISEDGLGFAVLALVDPLEAADLLLDETSETSSFCLSCTTLRALFTS